MKIDWKEYNKQLVKRGEIIIDEDIFLSENTDIFKSYAY